MGCGPVGYLLATCSLSKLLRGGLPISGPHCCCFGEVVTLLGGWLLVVVFFRDMVFKDRAGSDVMVVVLGLQLLAMVASLWIV